MILTKFLIVKTHTKLKSYYERLGYDMSNIYALIRIEDVPKSSHSFIYAMCDVCGNIKNIRIDAYYQNYNHQNIYACSHKCANGKRINTCLTKYGCDNVFQNDNIKEKIFNTNIEKYGNGAISKNDSVKKKIKKTNIDKYGFTCSLLNDDVKHKTLQTNISKYGHKSHMQSETGLKNYQTILLNKYGVKSPLSLNTVKEKIKVTNIEKYGEDNYFKSVIFKNDRDEKLKNQYSFLQVINVKDGVYTIKCDICGSIYDIDNNLLNLRLKNKNIICTVCNSKSNGTSGFHVSVLDFIKNNYTNEILVNDRKKLNGLELDIYLPDINVAFEVNGIYWHSELYKEKNYHKNKTELCEKSGIHLIHIYEDDWINKNNIIKSRILNIINRIPNRIYARKCEIRELTKKENSIVKKFLVDNHMQGYVSSQINVGLFHSNTLVSLMTFGKRRVAMGVKRSVENEYEMLRFCNILNNNVVGGASKLLSYFIKKYNPVRVTTYADRSWSNGNLYKKLGFKFLYKTNPNYYYIINNVRKHRFNFRKDVLVKQGFDKNKTEVEIMHERGVYRIFDSGNIKFEMIFE